MRMSQVQTGGGVHNLKVPTPLAKVGILPPWPGQEEARGYPKVPTPLGKVGTSPPGQVRMVGGTPKVPTPTSATKVGTPPPPELDSMWST